jgi:hypothetical protein
MDYSKEENNHYRQVADWDEVMKVYLHLKDINWQLIERQVGESAQRSAARSIWFGWRERIKSVSPYLRGDGPNKFRLWVGSLTPRWPTLYYGKQWTFKPIPPVTTPAERALHLLAKQRAFYANYYANKIETEQAIAVNHREYLAQRLKDVSTWIGGYQVNHYLGAGGPHSTRTWHLHHNIGQVVRNEHSKTGGGHVGREPDNVARAWEEVNYFWLCWREFHEAEQVQPTTSAVIEVEKDDFSQTPAPELQYLDTSLTGGLAEMAGKAFADAEKLANAEGYTLLPPNKKVSTPKLASIKDSVTSPVSKNETRRLRHAGRGVSWEGLLRPPLDKAGFYNALVGLRLLTQTGELTILGKEAPPRFWAGIVAALREKNYILLDYEATHKALIAEFGITMAARSLNPSTGLSTEALNMKQCMLTELKRVVNQH